MTLLRSSDANRRLVVKVLGEKEKERIKEESGRDDKRRKEEEEDHRADEEESRGSGLRKTSGLEETKKP